MNDNSGDDTASPHSPDGDRADRTTTGPARPGLSEAHYRAVFDSAHDFAIFTTDLGGQITSWNPGAETLLGWPAAEAVGAHVCMIFTPEDQAHDACEREMRIAADTGRAEDERWHLRQDKSRVWASGLMMRFEDDATGEHIGFLKILRDRTPQHQAETRLRESEAMTRTLFESSADCVKIMDLDGRLQSMNGPGMCLMEIDEFDPLVGQAWRSLWPEPLRDELDRALTEARDGGVGRFHGFCPTAKGTPKWWDVQVSAVPGPGGEPVMLLAASRDMTERTRAQTALDESEGRFRNLADHAPLMMWVTEPDGYCSYLNQRWYEFTGQTREEALGLGWTRATHPDDSKLAEDAFLAAVSARGPFRVEYRLRRADGTYRWAIDTAAPRFAEDGSFMGHVGSVIDIDDHREAEDALRHANALLAAVMEAVPGVVYAKDRAGRMLTANRGTAALLGKPLHDIIGRTDAELLDDAAQADAVMANDRRILAEDRTEVTEEQVSLADGSPATWLSTKAPFRDAAGTVIGLVGSSIDISELKRTQQALRQLNETLEARVVERTAERDRMWETSPDLMVIIDFEGFFRRVNPAWTTLLGYAPDELIGRHVNDFVIPEDHRATVDAYERTAAGGNVVIENCYRHKDGSTRSIAWVAAPANDVTYAVGRDVTADKVRQAELETTQESLRQSQKLEAVGQLTGGVAHDFNNLLTVIRGSVDLLRRPGLTDERRERYLEAISETTARATKLTGQLLAFARRQTLKPQVFDVSRNVNAVSQMIGSLIGSRIALRVDAAPAPLFVNADPNQFDTALVNIAVNARDAMNGEGQLTISVAPASGIPSIRSHAAARGNFVAISIADTGSGIADDQVEHIFEPFFTTKDVGQGTGLGLSQVFGFAKQSGGDVAVTSAAGQGAVFTLYLPATGAPPADERPGPVGLLSVDGRGTCVLVVEDNASVGAFAVQALEELGYDTLWVEDASRALSELAADADRFDVVFSDVVMPGMSGIELGHEIRRRHPQLPIVLASGYSHVLAQDGTHGFELLSKPYSLDALSRVLAKAIGPVVARAVN